MKEMVMELVVKIVAAVLTGLLLHDDSGYTNCAQI